MLKTQILDLTLEDVGKFSPNDVRRAVAIVFTRKAPFKGIFLDRIVPVREKQDIYLPPLAIDEAYGLFHADKRGGMMLAEFSGTMENMIIRQAVDALAEISCKSEAAFSRHIAELREKKRRLSAMT